MTFSMTVVSTITCCMLELRTTPPRWAASMLVASNISTSSSSSPMRFLQRVRLEGQMGSSV